MSPSAAFSISPKIRHAHFRTEVALSPRRPAGRGYLLGLRRTSDPAQYLPLLRAGGLLCPSAGLNTIRLLPPLIATAEHLTLATDIIRGALKKKEAADS